MPVCAPPAAGHANVQSPASAPSYCTRKPAKLRRTGLALSLSFDDGRTNGSPDDNQRVQHIGSGVANILPYGDDLPSLERDPPRGTPNVDNTPCGLYIIP